MRGKGAILEDVRVDAAIQTNATSSSLYSRSYSIKGVHRVSAHCIVGIIPATGAQVNFSIVGGNATEGVSSYVALTNATLAIGTSSTAGTIADCLKARISVLGSAMTTAIRTITVDGITLHGASNATYATNLTATAVGFIGAGAASAVAKSLTTAIQANATNVNATYSNTGATVCYVDVEYKPERLMSSGLNVSVTAQTTVGNDTGSFMAQAMLSQGIISFDAADLISTNTSYTNFAVLVNCTLTSVVPVAVNIFRDVAHLPSFQGLHKKDMSTSAAI